MASTVNQHIHDALLRFYENDYYYRESSFIAITPDELCKQLQLRVLFTASKELIHYYLYANELVVSYRKFTLAEQGEYVLDRQKALAFLTKDRPVASQEQPAVATLTDEGCCTSDKTADSDETCTMSDEEIVRFLQSRAHQIRNGEEFTVMSTKGNERWPLINHSTFSPQNLFPTAYYAASTRGRLLTNGGTITDMYPHGRGDDMMMP